MEEATLSPKPEGKKERQLMDFPDAIRKVIEGKRITKVEWKDEGYYGWLKEFRLKLHKPDGSDNDWIISDGDLNGKDWYVL
jgi:hypothetical protein